MQKLVQQITVACRVTVWIFTDKYHTWRNLHVMKTPYEILVLAKALSAGIECPGQRYP